MFFAMNRFKVIRGREADFEEVWRTRDSHLHTVPGYVRFHLLKGPEREDHTLYSSHTTWESRAAFDGWTVSEAFRRAHARAGRGDVLTIGHPEFEGFEVLMSETGEERRAAEGDAA